ncbi:hypothetical protein AB0F25_17675 [Streptomyces wedmorensis]|uniref:hypothetical protein n=1 Tax=Streptomyces wedmorensis TaxID=43759 RepID=UPI00342C423F
MNDSDRVQWHYTPFENVGPLRFGTSHEEAGAAMELQGFTGTVSSMHQRHGDLVLQAVFREMSAPAYVRAVTVYYRESGGLACVVVDALCGPLVSMDGMQLVGRVPSELTDEFHDYQEGRGMSPMISVEGDAASDELGIMVRAQRAGDILLSRPVFARFDGWAHTVHDCVPRDEWTVR